MVLCEVANIKSWLECISMTEDIDDTDTELAIEVLNLLPTLYLSSNQEILISWLNALRTNIR